MVVLGIVVRKVFSTNSLNVKFIFMLVKTKNLFTDLFCVLPRINQLTTDLNPS